MTNPTAPTSTTGNQGNLATDAQRTWARFLDTFEPLRADLYRYGRYLTRSPWDAEDLAQDTLARAFATLARMGEPPPNPRAWLFRIASNLWIDQLRRRTVAGVTDIEVAGAGAAAPLAPDPRDAREAAGTLLVRLSPQERAAVVLKDVFDFSLEETAAALGTSIGGIKAALHRGRGKLEADGPETAAERAPVPGVLDAFCRAFNAGDIDQLTALLLDNVVVEVAGASTQLGPDAARRGALFGMLFGTRKMRDGSVLADDLVQGVLDERPRVEPRLHRGRWFALHWYQHADGDFVRAVTTLAFANDGAGDGDRIAALTNYFFTPELLVELGRELGVPVRVNGYRWCKL